MVQVYRSDLDYTFSTTRKLEPKWSAPRRVINRTKNSYRIETLKGLPINGRFSSRRLRQFIPRGETSLAKTQEMLEKEWRCREDVEDRIKIGEDYHSTELRNKTTEDNTVGSEEDYGCEMDQRAGAHEGESGRGIEEVDEESPGNEDVA